MGDTTLAIKNNVVSRKRLIGIAAFVAINSEAKFLSKGNEILSTEQEIRDTKKASVLLPLLTGVKDVADVLKQARDGGVQLAEGYLNEFTVNLANEKITTPQIWRPRDGETINANGLFDRYKGSYQISATVAKDQAYYETSLQSCHDGVAVIQGIAATDKKLKGRFVKRVAKVADIKTDAFNFANQIRELRAELKMTADKLTQMRFKNSDFCIVLNSLEEVSLQNDARYNMYTEKVQNENGILSGEFDGSPILVTKRDNVAISARVQLFGAAVSVFALRSKMNADKITGVDAYAASLEFDEGTGVFLPHMITFIMNDVTVYTEQDRVTFDALVLAMNKSTTINSNATGSEGLGAAASNDEPTNVPEVTIFDESTFKGDVTTLTAEQRTALKAIFGLASNAPNATLQAEIDKR